MREGCIVGILSVPVQAAREKKNVLCLEGPAPIFPDFRKLSFKKRFKSFLNKRFLKINVFFKVDPPSKISANFITQKYHKKKRFF